MVCRWIVGLTVSLVGGGLVVLLFLVVLRRSIGLATRPAGSGGVPGWLTGGLERLFFTILVGIDATGTSTAGM